MARGEAPGAVEGRWRPGVAYEGKSLATEHSIHKGVDVFAPVDKVHPEYLPSREFATRLVKRAPYASDHVRFADCCSKSS